VLRPVAPDGLAALRRACLGDDATLDLALLRIGILSPVDLSEIRVLLTVPGTTLQASVNGDGHRIVEVVARDALVAQLHHDGRVFALDLV
jgi:hypothetical protein